MSSSRRKIGWRRWLLLVLFAGIAVVVITRFANARRLVATLAQGNPWWIGIGIGIHVLFFAVNAQLYVFGFAMVDVKGHWWHLLSILLAGLFVNAAVPTGGAGAAALFVDDARYRGQSGVRAAVGTVLVLFVDLATLLPFLVYGVWFLYTQGYETPYVLAGGAVYTLYILLLAGLLFLAKQRPEGLRRAMERIRRGINHVTGRVHRGDLLGSDWVPYTIQEFAVAANAIAARPRELLVTLAWATFMHVVNVGGLYAFFVAFQQPIGIGTLVAGWALGIVFYVVTIIPHIIAAVEAIMLLVFTSQGIPASTAGAVIVAYRGVSFWLPVLLGFVSLRKVPTFRSGPDRQEGALPGNGQSPN